VFEYFPDNYPWSLSVSWAVEVTGTFSEIHDAIHGLRSVAKADPRSAGVAWYEAWHNLAARHSRIAVDAATRCFTQGAGRSYFRAGVYELMAIRFLPPDDPRGLTGYAAGSAHFVKGLQKLGRKVRRLDVPYQEGFLPGLLALPDGPQPAPCIIVFGGFDSLKEWVYPILLEPFLNRGLGLFVVDQAGVGGALRLYGLPAVPESERSATACIDALSSESAISHGPSPTCWSMHDGSLVRRRRRTRWRLHIG
jgi:hypothetical protein